MPICIFIKDNGEKCRAECMIDSEYCYFHSPDMEEDRKLVKRGRKPKLTYEQILDDIQARVIEAIKQDIIKQLDKIMPRLIQKYIPESKDKFTLSSDERERVEDFGGWEVLLGSEEEFWND